MGCANRDVLAILAKNSIEYFEFQFACMRLGAMMLPINWRLAVPEILFILNDSRSKGLLYSADFEDQISVLRAQSSIEHVLCIDAGEISYASVMKAKIAGISMSPQTSHETPMTIMYTSGTTGHPKGVLITHGMTFWNAINISIPTGINRHSTHYVVLPTFHTAGLNLYANPIVHVGGTNIIAHEFDPGLTLQTISNPDLGVTHFFGVPAIYLFLSQHEQFTHTDLSGIQSWGCGGAPCR